jgi:4'-phosphopantetheinyl transferase
MPAQGKAALRAGEVHVWRVDLAAHGDAAGGLAGALDDEERARAQRFYFERDRRRFAASHAILRDILRRYLGISAGEVRFTLDRYGKPSLAGEGERGDLRFNMSHSGELALYAVAAGRDVGVDVEYTEREFDFDAIAERFFSVAEAAEIRALAAGQRAQAFFNCWTRKEAYIKARGLGLFLELDSFSVSTVALTHGEAVAVRLPPDAEGRWSVVNVDAGRGYAAAVAAEGAHPRVAFFDWA